MSRITAAFVCALCDPDNPRPASIMCSNNCGRYVCAAHATPRKGPGSAMICLSCAEALGLIDRPKPQPAPEVRPLIEIPPEPEPQPAEPKVTPPPTPVAAPVVASAASSESAGMTTQPLPHIPANQPSEQATVVTPKATPSPAKEATVIDSAAPVEPQITSHPAGGPEPAPKPSASETIVSQRGNTLQVPKVAPTLGKPPTPITKPRKALRATSHVSADIDWITIGMGAGTVIMGILGILFIILAVRGG